MHLLTRTLLLLIMAIITSAVAADAERGQLLPQVTMAVSAMTVHVRLQQEGYIPILF